MKYTVSVRDLDGAKIANIETNDITVAVAYAKCGIGICDIVDNGTGEVLFTFIFGKVAYSFVD